MKAIIKTTTSTDGTGVKQRQSSSLALPATVSVEVAVEGKTTSVSLFVNKQGQVNTSMWPEFVWNSLQSLVREGFEGDSVLFLHNGEGVTVQEALDSIHGDDKHIANALVEEMTQAWLLSLKGVQDGVSEKA